MASNKRLVNQFFSNSIFLGSFNVLHSGHLRLLRFAKECGDRFIGGAGIVGAHAARLGASVQFISVKGK